MTEEMNIVHAVNADVVGEAVLNGVMALEPEEVGDFGMLVTHPVGWVAEVIDTRKYEATPRYRADRLFFSRWQSLVEYVKRYQSADTLAYITDVGGLGPAALTADRSIVSVILDDHPVDGVANRSHTSGLTMRPTPAARRWGAALAVATIDQEALLDLVVDGITEIAEPPGAELRDLVADLHAVRTTEARSVIRSGGGSTVEVADNVALHAGTGNTLTIPEYITIVFQPWTAVDDRIVLRVKIKARIANGNRVAFSLTAPDLDDKLSEVVANIASLIGDATDLVPLWVP